MNDVDHSMMLGYKYYQMIFATDIITLLPSSTNVTNCLYEEDAS